MPHSNTEAVAELIALLETQERSAAWLARKLNVHRMWVSNRLNEKVRLGFEDYTRMRSVLDPETFA